MSASEQIASQFANGNINKHTWGDILYNVKAYGAVGNGVHDDTTAIQSVIDLLPSGTLGGGTVFFPSGTYKTTAPLIMKTGIKLEGVSPTRSLIVNSTPNSKVLYFNGASRCCVEKLQIAGAGNNGTIGARLEGESLSIVFRNVWFESLSTGVNTNFAYFILFDTCRTMGTPDPYKFDAASNGITLLNSSMVATNSGVTWLNSSDLNIIGCGFEGKAMLNLYNSSGLNIQGSYFEDMGGSTYDAWIALGNGVGGKLTGASIRGNFFNIGAKYGINFMACEGVSVEGNSFNTTVAAFEVYTFDNAPKRDIRIGSNQYNINGAGYDPTKITAIVGPVADSLNNNFTFEISQAGIYDKVTAPPDSAFNIQQASMFWDGVGFVLKQKDSNGTISSQNITGRSGASTLFSGTTSVVITHNLGRPPVWATAIADKNVGAVWISNLTNNTIQFNCAVAPGSNASVYWEVR